MSGPATPRIIRHVTQALIRIIESGLTPPVPTGFVQAAPPEVVSLATGQILALYLYRVVESPDLKNRGPVFDAIVPTPPGDVAEIAVRRDPLTLNLHYLLIPFSPSESFLDTYDLLGESMKALHDNAIFTLGEWPGVAGLTPEEAQLEFRIVPEPLSTTELAQIWEAVHQPYRLSVSYVLRTVQIQSDDEQTIQRVTTRRIRAGQE